MRILPLRLSAPRRALLAPHGLQVVPGLRRLAYGRMRAPLAALYARVAAPAVAHAAAACGAEVVHAWGAGFLLAASLRAARARGLPAVVTGSVHPGRWGDDACSVAAYRAANRVVAHLESEAAVYRDLGVPAGRVSVCGGCSPGVASGGGPALRRRLGITGPLVLFVGARRSDKGVDVLLESASLIARDRPDATFAFVGPGDAVVSRNGARVLDAGAVDEDERAAWLEAADVLCLPSAAESFGIVLLEAWSVGTPVLVSDVPALAELAAASGGGVSVARTPAALAQALAELLAEPDRLRTLGERGREFWRRTYTPRAVADRHETLYHALDAGGPG